MHYIILSSGIVITDEESNNATVNEGSLILNASLLPEKEEFTIHNEVDMNLLQPSFSDDNNKETVVDAALICGSVSKNDVHYGVDLEEPYDFMSSSQNLSGLLQCINLDDFTIANYDPNMSYNETAEKNSEATNAPILT
eukprot:5529348-Ditylum_brightwellii.AAC.1